MSLNENQKEQLIRYLDGQVTDSEREAVKVKLLENKSARKFLRDVAEQAVVIADVERTRLVQKGGQTQTEQVGGGELSVRSSVTGGDALLSTRRGRKFSWGNVAVLATMAAAIAALASLATFQWAKNIQAVANPIAYVTEFGGGLQWIGDGGIVNDGLKVGDSLEGGTLECFANSWATIEMLDGSEVTVVGPAELTMSDRGQKILYLDGGKLSANVAKQPLGLPMIIHTPAARMDVLGTQLNVDAQSISTMLTVNEGNVKLTRLVDGADCEVKADEQVVASIDHSNSLKPRLRSEPVDHWNVGFDSEPVGFFGKWLPADGDLPSRLKTLPLLWTSLTQEKPMLIHLAWVRCREAGEGQAAPIVLKSKGVFRITARTAIDASKKAPLIFVVKTSNLQGGFAGSYLAVVDPETLTHHENGAWVVDLSVASFIPDPENEKIQQTKKIKTFASPVGLQLTEFMGISVTEDIGLEILNVNLSVSDGQSNEAGRSR